MTSKETPVIDQKTAELGIAAILAARAQIEDLRLLSTDCWQNAACKLSGTLNVQVSIDYKADTEEKKIFVRPNYRILADYLEPEIDPLRIQVEFLIIYSFETLDDVDEDQIRLFSEYNGRYNSWAYLREYVHQITGRMNLPPLILPVYRPQDDFLHEEPRKGNRLSKASGSSKKSKPKKKITTKKKGVSPKKKRKKKN